MTWKLTAEANYQQTNEYRLTLTHLKSNAVLRQWFGPMAQKLFNLSKSRLVKSSTHTLSHSLLIEKQAAQHFLIEASFYHQKCLQQYQITSDLKNKQLTATQELCELLLYIRMTSHHPSHENLYVFADSHLPCNLEFDQAIKSLLVARLIQKIEFLHFKFYDKNPYPHDHIFDCNNQTLKDHHCTERVSKQQKLINHQVPT